MATAGIVQQVTAKNKNTTTVFELNIKTIGKAEQKHR